MRDGTLHLGVVLSQRGARVDDVYRYNKERWEALVEADALFTRPWLDLDEESAYQRLGLEGGIGGIRGKDVLCLACGGGQQSTAFSVLGAKVTVLDISDGQLKRDRQAARQYGYDIKTVQGDMRDLSAFPSDRFDLVWHGYSINFVPTALEVFREIGRVIRPSGLYHFMAANPFAVGLGTPDWNGGGYTIRHRYEDGAMVAYEDEDWVFGGEDAPSGVQGPREYRHTLSSLVNGLVECGFLLLRTKEYGTDEFDRSADPGTWRHLVSVVPPWIMFWAVSRPEVLSAARTTQ